MRRLILALGACAGLARPALAAAPIGYTAPDGVNAVAVTPANPLPVGPAQSNAAAPAAGEGQPNLPLSLDLNRNLRVVDSNGAAFQGEVALTVGTADSQARRSLKAVCSAAGNVSVTYADASTGAWAVQIGTQTLPIAITTVNTSGTTATCTYANLK